MNFGVYIVWVLYNIVISVRDTYLVSLSGKIYLILQLNKAMQQTPSDKNTDASASPEKKSSAKNSPTRSTHKKLMPRKRNLPEATGCYKIETFFIPQPYIKLNSTNGVREKQEDGHIAKPTPILDGQGAAASTSAEKCKGNKYPNKFIRRRDFSCVCYTKSGKLPRLWRKRLTLSL